MPGGRGHQRATNSATIRLTASQMSPITHRPITRVDRFRTGRLPPPGAVLARETVKPDVEEQQEHARLGEEVQGGIGSDEIDAVTP